MLAGGGAITAVTDILMLIIRLHMATTIRRLLLGITRLRIRRIPTMHPIGTTGLITLPITNVRGHAGEQSSAAGLAPQT